MNPSETNADTSPSPSSKWQELLKSYKVYIHKTQQDIEACIDRLLVTENREDLEALYYDIHKIAGTAEMYEFTSAGRLCRYNEKILRQMLETDGHPEHWKDSLLQFRNDFRHAVLSITETDNPKP